MPEDAQIIERMTETEIEHYVAEYVIEVIERKCLDNRKVSHADSIAMLESVQEFCTKWQRWLATGFTAPAAFADLNEKRGWK
jgi:hypothetical protein